MEDETKKYKLDVTKMSCVMRSDMCGLTTSESMSLRIGMFKLSGGQWLTLAAVIGGT